MIYKKRDTAPVVTQIVKTSATKTPVGLNESVLTPIGRLSPTNRKSKGFQSRSMKLGEQSVIVKPRVSPTMMTRRRARTLSQQTATTTASASTSQATGLLNNLTQCKF